MPTKNDDGQDVYTATELAEMGDLYWKTYQERLAQDKVAAALKTEESKLSALLIAQMRQQGLTSIGGKLVRLAINTIPDQVPVVTDWQAFYDYILETKDFSLLERRIGKSAMKERWSNDVEVPGTDAVPVYKLSKSTVKG
jgi:hypothetical protein